MAEAAETVERFRRRARDWLADSIPRRDPDAPPFSVVTVTEEQAMRSRQLQRLLWEGGFAGIVYPREYGGLGLTPEHQRAFSLESIPYEMPLVHNLPTLTILGPTLLGAGSEAQKRRHIPAMLRGDELWVQLLSEPTGGSDLAGVISRADRTADGWVLNGSKTWTSYAMFSDYGLCLARTDWDAPKHRGLTMFIVQIHRPGVTVKWIRQSNGARDFCEEFFDDVALTEDAVIGEPGEGWEVARRLLEHEKIAVSGGSPYANVERLQHEDRPGHDLAASMLEHGRAEDAGIAEIVGSVEERSTVHRQLVERVSLGLTNGKLPPPASSLLRLSAAETGVHRLTSALDAHGTDAVVWPVGTSRPGVGDDYVFRQASALGGGTAEMSRNIISERLLGMPRDRTDDRERPFRDVRRNSLRG